MDQDLNCGNEDTEQPLSPTNVEVDFASLTIEEMEERLEIGRPMENEYTAYGLYCIYARKKGFSVRKDKLERFTDGSGIRARDFLCSCEGNKNENRSRPNIKVSEKPTFRCNCKAKLRVARLKGQNWRISVFKKEHNHDMYSADQTYLLRSARNVGSEMGKCIESMVKCGIPVARTYEFLQTSSNGRENVGFTQKDIHNSLSRKRKESKLENMDAAQLLDHFKEMSNKEPYFDWNMEIDENCRLTNLFFRDYRCSIDYEYFGDVLSFDTTYRTNKYNMMCCPFVGVNHHLQNVMFGFAFLSDETEDSFEWLFRTFLKSMNGKQPKTIFTDQCQAMMNAIETVFPYSHHQLCQWHVNQNAPSHFGDLKNDSSFKNLWYKCMSDCHTEEEFELTWREMIDKYEIGKIKWFNIMYGLRHKWATVFSCHRFCAGLKATSRSECANAALKRKFGGATSTLYDCVLGYEKVQSSWRMDEKEKDTLSHHGRPSVGHNVWLRQVVQVYTLEILMLFHKEVSELINFAITHQQDVDTSVIWFSMVSRLERSRIITVQFNVKTLSTKCSCHKFETFGILCSHALKVFDRMNVDSIPEIYIKKRWTKSMTNRISDQCFVNGNNISGASDMAFVNEIIRGTYDLAARAQFYKETRFILTEALEYAKLKLNTWFENFSLNDLTITGDLCVEEDNTRENEVFVRDPHLVKSKGVTNVRDRHWDAKSKKGKGKAGNPRNTTNVSKRKKADSRIDSDFHLSQESRVQSSQEGTLQPLDTQSFVASQNDTYEIKSYQQFVYPFQRAFLVSRPELVQPSSQLQWPYAMPFSTNPGVGSHFNIEESVQNRYPYGDHRLTRENTKE